MSQFEVRMECDDEPAAHYIASLMERHAVGGETSVEVRTVSIDVDGRFERHEQFRVVYFADSWSARAQALVIQEEHPDRCTSVSTVPTLVSDALFDRTDDERLDDEL